MADEPSLIEEAHRASRKVGICGQAPSDCPEFAAFLVEQEIDSISLRPGAVVPTTRRSWKWSRRQPGPEDEFDAEESYERGRRDEQSTDKDPCRHRRVTERRGGPQCGGDSPRIRLGVARGSRGARNRTLPPVRQGCGGA